MICSMFVVEEVNHLGELVLINVSSLHVNSKSALTLVPSLHIPYLNFFASQPNVINFWYTLFQVFERLTPGSRSCDFDDIPNHDGMSTSIGTYSAMSQNPCIL